MSRVVIILAALLLPISKRGVANEPTEGNCMIINTTSDPVTIGIYRTSLTGISEQIVNVAPKTELSAVPIKMVADAQFVVAYKAALKGDKVERATPIQILGQKQVRNIRKAKDPETPLVLIHFRGGSIHGRPDVFNTALYIPDAESEGRRVLRDANHTQTLVKTPLSKQKFDAN